MAASNDQDRYHEWWQRLIRFEACSIGLARQPDDPANQQDADLAAWQAAGVLRDALNEVERLRAKLTQLDNDLSGPRRALMAIRRDIQATLGWDRLSDDDERAGATQE